MPDFRAERGPFERLRVFGAIGLGVLAVSAGLELTGGHASSPLCALVLAVTGFACLAGYVRHARRAAYPLIGLGMFKTRTFAVGIAGNVVARLGIGEHSLSGAPAASGGAGLTRPTLPGCFCCLRPWARC